MKSLLDALQDGRLIELPDSDKTKALEYLATLIEAIPDLGVEGGITEGVLAREKNFNTGIGAGWACPHTRMPVSGEVLCAVGWSPKGIDYGAFDGQPVHVVVMYYVPEEQKHAYLKEISSLAKAIKTHEDLQHLRKMEDLGDVRDSLLNAISVALEQTVPDAKARMIQLEIRQSALQKAETDFHDILPLTILAGANLKPIVLCQDAAIVKTLEEGNALAERHLTELTTNRQFALNGIRVLLRSSASFHSERFLHDCIALRTPKT